MSKKVEDDQIAISNKPYAINNNTAETWELEELLKKDHQESEHEEAEDTSWRKVSVSHFTDDNDDDDFTMYVRTVCVRNSARRL